MSFTTFLTVVLPYLFLFFVLFIALPYVASAIVVGFYEYLTDGKKKTVAAPARHAKPQH
ncbi:hypothetical protein SAMN04488540_101218 [Ferrimonas sediminum]|uniref:Uncharacterized protein n=1 Tax=Ferrimonas sediminum TaxID=718193 RepID=A0A1G8K2S9_9GAMM|nr:hypothetical protein [Ferrimonas sediminum]SDI37110.1 hypothetical protein SAMN04488540_101218 [Ferrimonas sediminum]